MSFVKNLFSHSHKADAAAVGPTDAALAVPATTATTATVPATTLPASTATMAGVPTAAVATAPVLPGATVATAPLASTSTSRPYTHAHEHDHGLPTAVMAPTVATAPLPVATAVAPLPPVSVAPAPMPLPHAHASSHLHEKEKSKDKHVPTAPLPAPSASSLVSHAPHHETHLAHTSHTGHTAHTATAPLPTAHTNTHTTAHVSKPHAAAEHTMVLSEEKLVVDKTLHHAGGLDIEKKLERTTASVPVTLEREVVTIERRPITHTDASTLAHTGHIGSNLGFGEKVVIRETVHAEQAIAQKKIAAREELQVSKEKVAQVENVSGVVRSERADIINTVGEVAPVRFDQGVTSHAAAATHSGAATAHTGAHTGTGAHSGSILDSTGKVVAFEERLLVDKDRIAAGEVKVAKVVDTTIASKPVTLLHDELTVSRHPIHGTVSVPIPTTLGEGRAHIDLTRERAHASTVVVPKEEIVVRKAVEHDQQMVKTELLKERIDIQPSQGAYTESVAHHAMDKHMGDKFATSSSSSSSSSLAQPDVHAHATSKPLATTGATTSTGTTARLAH